MIANKLNNLKFRAECYTDVGEAIQKIKSKYYSPKVTIEQEEVDGEIYPDETVEITTEASLEQIIEILEYIDDGHRMAETVNYKELYTGEILDR